MRFSPKLVLKTATLTSASSAPTLATDGESCLITPMPSGSPDEYLIGMEVPAGKDTTTITFRAWFYMRSVWRSSTLYTLNATGDASGGAFVLVPGFGGATKIAVELVSLDGGTPGVVLDVHASEHGEQQ